MTQEPQRKENATVAQTVAAKFTQLPERDKAYVMGYLMGKEDERHNAEKQSA